MSKGCIALSLALLLLATLLTGCTKTEAPAAAPLEADTQEEDVVLTIAGSWPDCRALDVAASAFNSEYPNCTIVYEYLQDYYPSLEKRMNGDSPVDLFFSTNIQADSEMLPYALDLKSCDSLDLSNTFDGLIENFSFREDNAEQKKLYSIRLGAEMRGLYVNTTLLSSLSLSVPTDQASLLSACQTLKDNGYIPFHGNPGSFAQLLIYPWICNTIVNADDPKAAYETVNSRDVAMSGIFREPLEFLYTLVENDYYDYKRAQTELNLFNDTADEDYARYFLNINKNDDEWEKTDDLGQIAFMPSTMSRQGVMDKTKDDYHSAIEYVFIMAPVSEDGGYAYMSPAHGIAVSKDSPNVEWSIKFLDFLFEPENNKAFAEAFNIIPNTKEALSYITERFDVPDDHISQLGQVTFDYGFYEMLQSSMTDISKANNPKYMKDNGDGTWSLYPFEHYMTILEDSIKEQ